MLFIQLAIRSDLLFCKQNEILRCTQYDLQSRIYKSATYCQPWFVMSHWLYSVVDKRSCLPEDTSLCCQCLSQEISMRMAITVFAGCCQWVLWASVSLYNFFPHSNSITLKTEKEGNDKGQQHPQINPFKMHFESGMVTSLSREKLHLLHVSSEINPKFNVGK